MWLLIRAAEKREAGTGHGVLGTGAGTGSDRMLRDAS